MNKVESTIVIKGDIARYKVSTTVGALVNGGHVFYRGHESRRKLIMGVDIATYRQRIGTFSMPKKQGNTIRTLNISRIGLRRYICGIRLLVCLTAILLTCGDIESNPGPETSTRTSRATRQATLSFGDDTVPSTDKRTPVTPSNSSTGKQPTPRVQTLSKSQENKRHQKADASDNEIMKFLQGMKTEFKEDMSIINSKIDNICTSVNNLQYEHEALRREHAEMRETVDHLYSKIDILEGHSRRNNLRFSGIQGKANEPWSETEERVRTFIKNDMSLPELENVEIERAHRVKSKDPDKCQIIVKFCKFKDRDQIFKSAKQSLKNTPHYVQEDFTERVKVCRRELGKRLVDARKKGLYASMQFDKLIIENEIYRYNNVNKEIYHAGYTRVNNNTRGRVFARDPHRTEYNHRSLDRVSESVTNQQSVRENDDISLVSGDDEQTGGACGSD